MSSLSGNLRLTMVCNLRYRHRVFDLRPDAAMDVIWTLTPPVDGVSPVGTVLFCTAAPLSVPEGPSASCTHPILLTACRGNS